MKRGFLFVTGTDTGVGKTVFAASLARRLRELGLNAAALKPICSGGRDDARQLHAATGGLLDLDEINPWFFKAPLSPLIAARRERRRFSAADVVRHAHTIQRRFPIVVVEGAGGLLSPMGEDFDSMTLIRALRAVPLVVAPNRLGVMNQVLLTLAAMPRVFANRARLILITQPHPDASSRSNLEFLREKLGAGRVFNFPWLNAKSQTVNRPGKSRAVAVLDQIAAL